MNETMKYDPEDIESLLLNKRFDELYPEEQEFVLRHIESRDEYESLRKTLFDLKEEGRNGDWIEPDARLKDELLAEFAREKRSGFWIWLNTLFASPTTSWYKRPGIQLAFATGVVLIGVAIFINTKNSDIAVAENQIKKIESVQSETIEEAEKDSAAYPPAPLVLAELKPDVTSTAGQPKAEESLSQSKMYDSVESEDEAPVEKEIHYEEANSGAPVEKTTKKENLSLYEADKETTLNTKASASFTSPATVNAITPILAKDESVKFIVSSSESASARNVSKLLPLLYTSR